MQVLTSRSSNIGAGEKIADAQKAKNLLSVISGSNGGGLVKTASTGGDNAVAAIVNALSSMGIKANIDISELLKKVAEAPMTKEAQQKSGDRQETVKIASKRIEDSHYDIDVAKSVIKKGEQSMIMVSAYMREAYLGRYLIKRNYYFLENNEKEADYIFDDLVEKFGRTRARYYDGKIGINGIFPEVKATLDATNGDLQTETEQIGSAYRRDTERGHTVNGPPNALQIDR